MDQNQQMLALAAVAATLGKKKINLAGQVLQVKDAVVLSDGVIPRLHLSLSVDCPEAAEKKDKEDCDCIACRMSRAVPARHAAAVTMLIIQGHAGDIVLDSSCAVENGKSFSVKLRDTSTKKCSAGTGKNLCEAIGRAVTEMAKSIKP